MAIKVPIVTEFNNAGLTDAERALRSFGVQSTTELKKAAVGFGVLGAAGAAAFSELDAGYDAIVANTGATGDALKGLKSDADAVAREVPNSFEEVGVAVAEVNTRLGLTGPAAQEMSKRFLDLARVANVDVQSAIGDTVRVFKDWRVEAGDQALVMDKLFAATQASGIGLDKLNTSVVQFGAPLRQMGFSLEESIALFSKFEAEGVNTEAVMSGLRQGLGKLSKAGEEPAEAFRRIVGEIENVATTGQANALAIETFGQRAGPDMAAAIREGRFELDEMVAALGDAGGALDTAAEETLSANDRFAMLKNQLLTAAGPAIEQFAGLTENLVNVLTLLPEPVQGVVVLLGALAIASKSAGSAMAAFGTKAKGAAASSALMSTAAGVAGVALVGYTLHAKQTADANAKLVASIDDLGRASDEEIARKFVENLHKGAWAGKGFDETLAQIARTSPGTLQRVLDLEKGSGLLTKQLVDNGESVERATEVLGYLETALEDEKVAIENAAITQQRSTEITDEATGAIGDKTEAVAEADSAEDLYAAAIEAQRVATEAAITATNERRDAEEAMNLAVLASFDSNLAYRNSIDSAEEAMSKAEATAYEYGAASEEADDALRGAESAALGVAAAAVRQAEDQAAANGETLSAQQTTAIYKEELNKLAGELDPGSPLRARLSEYIGTLNATPKSIETVLTLREKVIRSYTDQRGGSGPSAGPGSTSNSQSHTGSRFAAGETKVVVPGQVFTPDVPGRLASVEESQRMLSPTPPVESWRPLVLNLWGERQVQAYITAREAAALEDFQAGM